MPAPRIAHPEVHTRRTQPDNVTRERLLADVPLTERTLRLNGVSTAVLEGGDGPPLILLHGPGEYAAKWLRVVPELIRTHRVIAPDLPGHGASQAIDGAINVADVLAWLDDLIECTCATRPTLVAHLLGGAIAARFAAAHSERIDRLVLVDALGLEPFQPAPEFGIALMRYMEEPSEETHDVLWSRCAFDIDALRDSMGTQWDRIRTYNLDRAQTAELKPTLHGLMATFALTPIPHADLTQIDVPVRLIWGRHDLAVPLAVAEAASLRYAWPLHVIEDAADDPPLEQPAAFLGALRAALANADGAADTSQAWNSIASAYDRTNTPTQMAIAAEGLRRAGLRPGMRVLDVASGSGALAIPAARSGAHVTAIDQSPAMLAHLAERAHAESLTIDTHVMDGHTLDFDDDSFDVAASQFGVMLFPDVSRGVREMARAVRAGGRVLILAYGDPHEIEFITFLIQAVRAVRPDFDGPPMDPPPLEFQLADPDRVARELSAAGLRDVSVETVLETTAHRSGSDLWEWLVSSNPIVETLLGGMLGLTDVERRAVRLRLDELFEARAGENGIAYLTNPVNIGTGIK
jgi:pimeloyl-ACP methyl ester carboxylesterase